MQLFTTDPLRRTATQTLVLALSVASLSCVQAQREYPGGGGSFATTSFLASITLLTPATPAGGITFLTGDLVDLPSTLTNRTILTGTVGGRVLLAPVLGSVIEVAGETANGRCIRPNEVDIGSIPPGSLLKPDTRVEVQPLAEVLFNEIIEKQRSATVGYLTFTAAMNKDDRAEVMIQDIAGQQVANWDAAKDTAKVRLVEGRALQPGMCGRYVITGIVLTAVSYRVFTSKKAEGSVLGIINLGHKNYFSHTKLQNDLKIGIQLQPIGFTPTPSSPIVPSPLPPAVIQFISR